MAAADRGFAAEWPTWLVAVSIYAGWALLSLNHAQLPGWLLALLGGYLVCWHGSLQHETVHGHPTRNPRINALLGFLPLSLWLPYPLYRASHLRHHRTRNLTLPGDDPESFYVPATRWRDSGPLRRSLLLFNNTLAGRLLIGPPLLVGAFLHEEARRARRSRALRRVWAGHALGVAVVLYWVLGVCQMPLWLYLTAFVWPGLSLTLLRSFHEHSPRADPAARTNLVRANPLLRLLFLNNNLHSLHHARPGLAWHRLPRAGAAATRAAHHPSYAQLTRRYLLRPRDLPAHPLT